jgi:cyclopropane-fatty-acyl-phospholipid synthase
MNSLMSLREVQSVSLKNRLLARWFARFISQLDAAMAYGVVEVELPDGSLHFLGGRGPGPVARLRLVKWRALVRIAQSGSIGWYHAWDKGEWQAHDPVPFFDLVVRNRASFGDLARGSGLPQLWQRLRHTLKRNTHIGARRNIQAHYDLGNDFYAAWLDETMSYSSAIFARPINGEEPLEDAQRRKVSALEDRLQLRPGANILEIGCGWGYVSRTLAKKSHRVTAITLSPAQCDHAKASSALLARPPDYELIDYRDVQGIYDAIVSVEMVEAVGQAYWPVYLDQLVRLLKPGGRAALQYIAIADDVFDAYAKSVDFIQTYIFPGGMLISESRFRRLAQERGLRWEDQVSFGLDYAETLRRWRVRFDDALDAGQLPKHLDAHFLRLWRYYLMYCEGGFRGGGITVSQVTLVKEGTTL